MPPSVYNVYHVVKTVRNTCSSLLKLKLQAYIILIQYLCWFLQTRTAMHAGWDESRGDLQQSSCQVNPAETPANHPPSFTHQDSTFCNSSYVPSTLSTPSCIWTLRKAELYRGQFRPPCWSFGTSCSLSGGLAIKHSRIQYKHSAWAQTNICACPTCQWARAKWS